MPWRAVRLFLIIMAAIIGIIGGLSVLAVLFEPKPVSQHKILETNLRREHEPPNVLREPQIVVRLIRS